MANVLIGSPIYSDVGVLYTPTFSGGSWEAGNPLTNLADRRLHKVARSSSAAVADTVLTCDLGVARSVRTLCIPKHTISTAGTVRGRGFLSVPVLDSLTVGDASWTAVNTPVRTAAAFTGPDGVPMDLIEDDNGAGLEGYWRTTTFTGDGTKVFSVRIKQGTSANSVFGLRDDTAPAWLHLLNAAWSGGVPTISTLSGSGSVLSTTLIGDGVYRVVCTAASVTAANTNRIYCYGATSASATTGSTYYANAAAWNATTDQQVYDSGYTSPWPSGWTAETVENLNLPWLAVVPEGTTAARYWRINVADSTNAAGSVDLARLCVTGGYQPTYNFSYGARVTLESETQRVRSDGGATIYDERPARRVARFAVENLPENEAWTQAWRTMRRLGSVGQCVLVLDPDATAAVMAESAFLAVPREMGALEYPQATYRTIPFAFEEEL